MAYVPSAVQSRRGVDEPRPVAPQRANDGVVDVVLMKPDHTSSGTIPVPRGTVVVRHALGHEKPVSTPYAAGFASVLGGTGLTVIGALGLTAGLVSEGSVDEQGRPIDNSGFVAFGGVLGGVGVAALVTGIVMMVANQPERRPGATTTFLLPSAPPASHSSWSAR
jgi:hypothetical protein